VLAAFIHTLAQKQAVALILSLRPSHPRVVAEEELAEPPRQHLVVQVEAVVEIILPIQLVRQELLAKDMPEVMAQVALEPVAAVELTQPAATTLLAVRQEVAAMGCKTA
jgi:hypothetical protein